MKTNWKKLLICIAIPLAVGGLSALVTGNTMERFQELVKPPLSPPGWLFPVVWTILYALMGWASYRILESDAPDEEKKKALILYGIQLLLNFIWSPVFFRWEMRLTAFFILLALWLAIYLTMRKFATIDETAADLLLPYILWVTFAAYLNLGIFLLN
ncbi:MAG: tryptophan-rich sensory protein [Oscillospiraceae bacterium]|nr:tryptophan-rich sensory protein [Oscillospiraceae bacterium]